MSKALRHLLFALALTLLCIPAYSQKKEKQDSLVRLMSAKSVRLLEISGVSYREAIDANFLHNDTYLICDTALWNVGTNVIDAMGNVKILQEETQLTGDKLTYHVDDNLAEFRGSLVQLQDKDKNTLRTRNLDYNTKDSVAVFRDGGSMRDKEGQIIESNKGTYESAKKTFRFEYDVNMYTDSVFIKTAWLEYQADTSLAIFNGGIDAWKGKNMISSKDGWYDRANEVFMFRNNVHGLSSTQELWCDSLFYWRTLEDVKMLGNVQVTDTTREVSAMAERMFYQDSVSRITMERNATVAAASENQGKKDTVYVSGDVIIYRDMLKGKIPQSFFDDSEKRMKELNVDPVSEYRRKAAAEAEEAANSKSSSGRSSSRSAAAKQNTNTQAKPADTPTVSETLPKPVSDTLATALSDTLATALSDTLTTALSDTLAMRASADSLAAKQKIAPPIDSTKIGFLSARGKVKVFRSDMQAVCDSLEYCNLDSLARLYIEPIVWNETNRQYRADSLTVIIKDKKMDRASLMSNAFIVIQEDTMCYDQIKGAEIMAYFNDDTELSRFDALGGANALFYLKENDVFATVNKVESKMLSAKFTEGEIDTIYYFDSPQNDAYPVVQFPDEERKMKGFTWLPELRPKGRHDITQLELKPSQRQKYEARPRPVFFFTNRFFPGHIQKIYAELARVDSLRAARQSVRPEAADSTASGALLDSLAARPDVADSLGMSMPADSLAAVDGKIVAVSDSLGVAVSATGDASEIVEAEPEVDQKALKRAEAERKRQEQLEKREKRWAELDARDAEKAAAKQAKADEKRRKATYKAILRKEKRAAKEQKQLDRYIERYRKKLLRNKPQEELVGEQTDDVQNDL